MRKLLGRDGLPAVQTGLVLVVLLSVVYASNVCYRRHIIVILTSAAHVVQHCATVCSMIDALIKRWMFFCGQKPSVSMQNCR